MTIFDSGQEAASALAWLMGIMVSASAPKTSTGPSYAEIVTNVIPVVSQDQPDKKGREMFLGHGGQFVKRSDQNEFIRFFIKTGKG